MLLLVIVPVVVVLLRGVLNAAKDTTRAVEALRPVADAASKDLDAVELLNTTQEQVSQTVAVVAELRRLPRHHPRGRLRWSPPPQSR